MNDTIKVHVVRYPNRNLVMRYVDPQTGRQVTRSTKTNNAKEAAKAAAKWEAELQEGRYAKRSRMTWEAWRDYYATNALPALADTSAATYEATLNVFERSCKPQRLGDVTTSRVTGFVTQLRANNLAEATIARHLRHLKAAMRWAKREGLLTVLPEFTMPKRAKGSKLMRGRPICLEEFERMVKAVPKIVGRKAVNAWREYLRGLWLSGLRLSESLRLHWDDARGGIVVDLTGRRPMLRIPAESQKSHRDTVLPITPDFAAWLLATPEAARRGRVFKLLDDDGKPIEPSTWLASRTIALIGEKAGIVVDTRQKGDETVRKFASAHDLRRAFGQRWAGKVMPTVLMELMRHSSVETTMKFYVGTNAEAAADAIWLAAGSDLGSGRSAAEVSNEKTPAKAGV